MHFVGIRSFFQNDASFSKIRLERISLKIRSFRSRNMNILVIKHKHTKNRVVLSYETYPDIYVSCLRFMIFSIISKNKIPQPTESNDIIYYESLINFIAIWRQKLFARVPVNPVTWASDLVDKSSIRNLRT